MFIFFQQGTAAFWFNLLKSGESDGSTRHAGCPVIVGSKWGKAIYFGLEEEGAFLCLCIRVPSRFSFIFLSIYLSSY